MSDKHGCQRFGPSGKCVDCGKLGAWDRCQAVSQPYLDQCGLAAGHSGFHEALNEAGVVSAQWGTPEVPKFAAGGLVAGPRLPGDDSLLIQLEPGYRLPRSAVEQLDGAAAVMRALNEGHVVPDPSGPVITNLFAPVPDGPTDPVIEADARRSHVAELASLQSKAVDQLTRRVLAAIEGVELRKDESTTAAMAAAAVNVFVEFLRTPPPIVTGVDGVTRIEQR